MFSTQLLTLITSYFQLLVSVVFLASLYTAVKKWNQEILAATNTTETSSWK